MTHPAASPSGRYARQVAFAPLGADGQERLARGRALIVGVGGLGSWSAELLARAGVGTLRLVDADRVDVTNIHRQALYTQHDAQRQRPKVQAAAERLAQVNDEVHVEAIEARLERMNLPSLAAGMDVIVDGTDNFATRYLLNDWCVRSGTPWVCAGVVAAEAHVMTFLPGTTGCLRCVLPTPPAACQDPNCRQSGVMGPAVAAIAAIQAAEAIKILAGLRHLASPWLRKLDLWHNVWQGVDLAAAGRDPDCPCCVRGELDYLEP